jgi:putative transposase
MAQKRKTHSEEFKARVAVEAIKGVRTLSELSAAHSVHPTVIAHWKRQLVEGASEVFRRGPAGGGRSEETVTAPLYQETCLPTGRPVLCVLQHRTTAPEPGPADAGRGTLRVRRGGYSGLPADRQVWTGGRSPCLPTGRSGHAARFQACRRQAGRQKEPGDLGTTCRQAGRRLPDGNP